MIRVVRNHALQTVVKMLSSCGQGRRLFLQVIIDLTNARKTRQILSLRRFN